MAAHSFKEHRSHICHAIACVCYGDDERAVNVAIECETCGEVLVDYDVPNPRLPRLIELVEKKDEVDPDIQVDRLDEWVRDAINQGAGEQVQLLVESAWMSVDKIAQNLDIDLVDRERGVEDV